MAELAEWLGLSRADSVPNLARRLEAQSKSQPELLDDFAEILRWATSVATDHGRVVKTPPKADIAKHHYTHDQTAYGDRAKPGRMPVRPRPASVSHFGLV